MKYLLIIVAVALASPALAQQQQQTPPELALQINGVIGTWAQTIVQQGNMIADLQKQLAASQARVKELEAKAPEPKK
jgi:hypothetical protein